MVSVWMQHLHAPDSDHFNIQLFEAEQVMDIFKIEHDIIDTLSFGSKNIEIVPSPNGFEPKSTCSRVPTMHPLHKRRNPFHRRVG